MCISSVITNIDVAWIVMTKKNTADVSTMQPSYRKHIKLVTRGVLLEKKVWEPALIKIANFNSTSEQFRLTFNEVLT